MHILNSRLLCLTGGSYVFRCLTGGRNTSTSVAGHPSWLTAIITDWYAGCTSYSHHAVECNVVTS